MPRIRKPLWVQATKDNLAVGDVVRIIPETDGTQFMGGGAHSKDFHESLWEVANIEDSPINWIMLSYKVGPKPCSTWYVLAKEIEVKRRPYA